MCFVSINDWMPDPFRLDFGVMQGLILGPT